MRNAVFAEELWARLEEESFRMDRRRGIGGGRGGVGWERDERQALIIETTQAPAVQHGR